MGSNIFPINQWSLALLVYVHWVKLTYWNYFFLIQLGLHLEHGKAPESTPAFLNVEKERKFRSIDVFFTFITWSRSERHTWGIRRRSSQVFNIGLRNKWLLHSESFCIIERAQKLTDTNYDLPKIPFFVIKEGKQCHTLSVFIFCLYLISSDTRFR